MRLSTFSALRRDLEQGGPQQVFLMWRTSEFCIEGDLTRDILAFLSFSILNQYYFSER